MQDRYTALVRGAGPVFPRGFGWLIPLWYLAIAALVVLSHQTPRWYTPAVLLGLLLAAASLATVLATMRNNAFAADDQGIWLGLRGAATRRGRRGRRIRQVPWDQVDQVQIRPRSYGAQVDILLRPAAHAGHRPKALAEITRTVLLLALPAACIGCAPGLLSPCWSVPLYRVRLYDTPARELRQALTARAPGAVTVTVMVRTWAGSYRPLPQRPPLIEPGRSSQAVPGIAAPGR